MKIYTNCRQTFVDAVEKVFSNVEIFFDFIEDEDYSNNYDCFATNYECYIIDRSTGEYINWYKFTHLGRDIHSTVRPDKFVRFLTKFKNSIFED